LKNTWIIVRIDGHGFHRFTSEHGFEKPNDPRGLHLANYAAERVMKEMQDLVLAYGMTLKSMTMDVIMKATNRPKR
jgi:tRNA(His) guanylyltransferase